MRKRPHVSYACSCRRASMATNISSGRTQASLRPELVASSSNTALARSSLWVVSLIFMPVSDQMVIKL